MLNGNVTINYHVVPPDIVMQRRVVAIDALHQWVKGIHIHRTTRGWASSHRGPISCIWIYPYSQLFRSEATIVLRLERSHLIDIYHLLRPHTYSIRFQFLMPLLASLVAFHSYLSWWEASSCIGIHKFAESNPSRQSSTMMILADSHKLWWPIISDCELVQLLAEEKL